MRNPERVLAFVVAASLALGGGVAFASSNTSKTSAGNTPSVTKAEKKSEVRRVRGEVTAVEPGAKTMVVKAMEGSKSLDIGVDITDKTIIREGKATKTLADLKIGDRVRLKYEKTADKLVADDIRILRPTSVAAKSKGY